MHRFLSTLTLAVASAIFSQTASAAPDVRIYRLGCGQMRLGDKSMMSDRGLYKGEHYDIVMSCYLIRHGADWILWDAGLPKQYLKGPLTEGTFTTSLRKTVVEQLRELKLSPGDITYVAVSHAHFDHAGQVNDFPNATLILQRAELAAIADTRVAAEHYIQADLFKTHIDGTTLKRVKLVDGDVDLFGDGALKTIQTPGHTPGSMALLVQLKNAGPYILSGDQWHFTENRVRNQVPIWNYSHDETIASSKKLEAVIRQTGATLVTQHEPVDNQKLPRPPAYLD